MSSGSDDTRRRILDAAALIARDSGAGNLSLDAVAAKAGVSKGGLLYHFSSKSKLLQSLVEFHLAAFEKALAVREQEKRDRTNGLMQAYVELFAEDQASHKPPPSGLLVAMAEDPGFLTPVRHHHRDMLDRLKHTGDPAAALVVFLAIQGVRCMELLNLSVLTEAELSTLFRTFDALLAEKSGSQQTVQDA